MGSKTTGFIRKGETYFENARETGKKGLNIWSNARFVIADVPLNGKELKKILPLGMWAGAKPMATLFICEYPEVTWPIFPYHEAAMLVHVRTPLGMGRHCCWMIVDDSTALVLGREMLGYPKKMGVFEFDRNDNEIHTSVSRRNTTVMGMKARIGALQEPAPPVFNVKTFNIGGPGQFVFMNPIWMFKPREIIHQSYEADIRLTLNDSSFDPLARLVAGEPVDGRFVTMDIPGTSPYMLPVGITGPFLFNRTFNMRFR